MRVVLWLVSLCSLLGAAAAGYAGYQVYQRALPADQVVVAAVPLEPGGVIRADQVALARTPPLGDAPVARQLEDVVGKVVTTAVPDGAPLFLVALADQAAWRGGAAPHLEVLAIPLPPDHALGGQLRPGLRVNLYQLPPPSERRPPELLVESAPVLSVLGGSSSPLLPAPSVAPADRPSGSPASGVVLALPPAQARRVLGALGEARAGQDLYLTLAPLQRGAPEAP